MNVIHARRLLRRHLAGILGLGLIVAVVAAAVFAPLLAPYSPSHIDLASRLRPPFWLDGGSVKHLLGTDNLGRDILSRAIYGSRISLSVGTVAVLVGAVIGCVVGLVAGYFSSLLDAVLSFLINVQLSFPFTLLAIFLLATFGGGFWSVVFVVALATWVNYARVVRGQVMSIKGQEFIEAAITVGVPTTRIIRRYILPNIASTVIVVASFSMAQAILTEAGLSFLGVGVSGANPSWGTMLSDGRNYIQSAWWMTAVPGFFTAVTVLAGNLCGDWLQDRTDPRARP